MNIPINSTEHIIWFRDSDDIRYRRKVQYVAFTAEYLKNTDILLKRRNRKERGLFAYRRHNNLKIILLDDVNEYPTWVKHFCEHNGKEGVYDKELLMNKVGINLT